MLPQFVWVIKRFHNQGWMPISYSWVYDNPSCGLRTHIRVIICCYLESVSSLLEFLSIPRTMWEDKPLHLMSSALPLHESVSNSELFLEPQLFVHVPWFSLYLWMDEPTVESWANSGVLLVRVPVQSLTFVEWYFHFIVPPRDILLRLGYSFPRAHEDPIHLLQNLILYVNHEFPVPSDSSLHTWALTSQ